MKAPKKEFLIYRIDDIEAEHLEEVMNQHNERYKLIDKEIIWYQAKAFDGYLMFQLR